MPADCGDEVLVDGWLHISADEYDERHKLDGVAVVDGDLVIRRSELANLDLLRCIREISGTLHIYDNDALVDVSGLWWVERLGGDLIVADNDALVEFDALARVQEIEGEELDPNSVVTHGVAFIRNASLERIRGLTELERIAGDLVIRDNRALVSLEGLVGLTEVWDAFAVNHNASLCPPALDEVQSGFVRTPRWPSAVGNAGGCTSPWPPESEPEGGCDQKTQDCPTGMRCTAAGASDAWSWTCRPLAEPPRDVGESCTIEEHPTSGIDDCRRGAVCLGEGPTGSLTCVETFPLQARNSTCIDPFEVAVVHGIYRVCLERCDPLAQECGEGRACRANRYASYPDGFICTYTSDETAGEPCDYFGCAPGLDCLDDGGEPTLLHDGECVAYCSVANGGCPAGQACTPWYAAEQAPPGLDDVGVCL